MTQKSRERPTDGLIAFEFVSPHGLPDGDTLHVEKTGALVLMPETSKLWSIIGSKDAVRIARAVLRAAGEDVAEAPDGARSAHARITCLEKRADGLAADLSEIDEVLVRAGFIHGR